MRLLIARPRLILAVWLATWGAIAFLMHVPLSRGVSSRIPYLDKFAHAGLYFLIAFLGAARLFAQASRPRRSSFLFWAMIYLAYGVVDELTQPLTGRTASVDDWLADAVGIAVATAIALALAARAKLSEP